jgi:hypothetical protein
MYATLRQYTHDVAMIAHAQEALAASQGLHAAQPRCAGSIVVDDGDHRGEAASSSRLALTAR